MHRQAILDRALVYRRVTQMHFCDAARILASSIVRLRLPEQDGHQCPRLMAAGVNLNRIEIVDGLGSSCDEGEILSDIDPDEVMARAFA